LRKCGSSGAQAQEDPCGARWRARERVRRHLVFLPGRRVCCPGAVPTRLQALGGPCDCSTSCEMRDTNTGAGRCAGAAAIAAGWAGPVGGAGATSRAAARCCKLPAPCGPCPCECRGAPPSPRCRCGGSPAACACAAPARPEPSTEASACRSSAARAADAPEKTMSKTRSNAAERSRSDCASSFRCASACRIGAMTNASAAMPAREAATGWRRLRRTRTHCQERGRMANARQPGLTTTSSGSSQIRHKYQLATVRKGRHASPWARSSFGAGSSARPRSRANPLRTP
jgi:hypothetical protein